LVEISEGKNNHVALCPDKKEERNPQASGPRLIKKIRNNFIFMKFTQSGESRPETISSGFVFNGWLILKKHSYGKILVDKSSGAPLTRGLVYF
ncbi:MAG TPA: hypothetical protein VII90_00160, partial [Anaerolineales bacterium]